MSDTHINAFFTEVDEAEKKVLAAHAEWETAKARLETKKKECGYVETPLPEIADTPSEEVKPQRSDKKR